ncbi:MAG TPA: protein disulfide oxidoreductase [Mycobacterium sp.]|nr:protein disulfide oxidoreductase [Mycobacterium sp.]
MATLTMLFTGACGSTSPASVAVGGGAGGASVPAQLQFTAETLDGHSFSGDSLLGKPAVLWFWAPWCPACQREAPTVGKVAAANPAVTFVGVGARSQPPEMKEFVDKYGLGGFTELADSDSAVWSKFGVTRQPAYAFVKPDGAIEVFKGSLSESELTARVQALTGR